MISSHAHGLPGPQCTRTCECECSLLLCRQLTSSDRPTTDGRTDGPSRRPHILFRPSVRPSIGRSPPEPPTVSGSREGGLTDRCIGRSDCDGIKRTTEMHATMAAAAAIMTFHFGLPHTLSNPNPTHQPPQRASRRSLRIKAEKLKTFYC